MITHTHWVLLHSRHCVSVYMAQWFYQVDSIIFPILHDKIGTEKLSCVLSIIQMLSGGAGFWAQQAGSIVHSEWVQLWPGWTSSGIGPPRSWCPGQRRDFGTIWRETGEWIKRITMAWDSVGRRDERSKGILNSKLEELREDHWSISADLFARKKKVASFKWKSLSQSCFLKKERLKSDSSVGSGAPDQWVTYPQVVA